MTSTARQQGQNDRLEDFCKYLDQDEGQRWFFIPLTIRRKLLYARSRPAPQQDALAGFHEHIRKMIIGYEHGWESEELGCNQDYYYGLMHGYYEVFRDVKEEIARLRQQGDESG